MKQIPKRKILQTGLALLLLTGITTEWDKRAFKGVESKTKDGLNINIQESDRDRRITVYTLITQKVMGSYEQVNFNQEPLINAVIGIDEGKNGTFESIKIVGGDYHPVRKFANSDALNALYKK